MSYVVDKVALRQVFLQVLSGGQSGTGAGFFSKYLVVDKVTLGQVFLQVLSGGQSGTGAGFFSKYLVVDKVALGQVFSKYLVVDKMALEQVFPLLSSHQCSVLILIHISHVKLNLCRGSLYLIRQSRRATLQNVKVF
jgi:hypothetical protein